MGNFLQPGAGFNIDFSTLERKRMFELGRLEDVISYAQTKGCRQAALIGYFGEKSNSWQCKCCDNCDRSQKLQGETRELDDEELDAFLFSLGCYSGESITVINRRRRNLTVAIKDGRYNIDRQLADAIWVES